MPRRCRPLLGTIVDIAADDERAVDAGFDAIARVHRLMSGHEPDSDLSRINRFAHLGGVQIDDWTAIVLERALSWSRESRGAFDVVRAGKAALECGALPRHGGQPPPGAAHWTWVELQGNAARLLKPACLDLGGIAKGFAVDRAVAAMRAAGARSGLVNAGGDMRGFGPKRWPVAVVDPQTRAPVVELELHEAALATSGILPGGLSGHLPGRDPQWASATVQAPSCLDSDALTKVLLAGSPEVGHCLDLAHARGFRMATDGRIHEVHREAVGA